MRSMHNIYVKLQLLILLENCVVNAGFNVDNNFIDAILVLSQQQMEKNMPKFSSCQIFIKLCNYTIFGAIQIYLQMYV